MTLKGPFAVDVAAEAEEGLTLSARLSVEDESSLRIESDADSVVDIEVTKSTPVVATLEYPSLDWKSGIDELRLRVAAEGGPVLPLKVSRLDCRSGIRCTLDVSATLEPRVVDDWQIGAVGVGLQGADLTADDGGWRVSSADLRIDVDRLGYRSRSIDVPIIRGRLEADGDGSTAELTLQAPGGGIDGAIGIRHEFATASGSMTIQPTDDGFRAAGRGRQAESVGLRVERLRGNMGHRGACRLGVGRLRYRLQGGTAEHARRHRRQLR